VHRPRPLSVAAGTANPDAVVDPITRSIWGRPVIARCARLDYLQTARAFAPADKAMFAVGGSGRSASANFRHRYRRIPDRSATLNRRDARLSPHGATLERARASKDIPACRWRTAPLFKRMPTLFPLGWIHFTCADPGLLRCHHDEGSADVCLQSKGANAPSTNAMRGWPRNGAVIGMVAKLGVDQIRDR